MSQILFIFALYSILGWVLEVVYFLIKEKKYVKRGVLGGPYCPLYGFSMATTTVLTYTFKENIVLVFGFSALICTFYEFLTAIIIDKYYPVRMWDYSESSYNFKGYICLPFSLIWGVLASFCILVFNPVVFNNTNIVSTVFSILVILCMIINIFHLISITIND